MSFISAKQACTNAEEEIPDFDFETTRNTAFDSWNELLGRIQVDTRDVTQEDVILFYSSVRIGL